MQNHLRHLARRAFIFLLQTARRVKPACGVRADPPPPITETGITDHAPDGDAHLPGTSASARRSASGKSPTAGLEGGLLPAKKHEIRDPEQIIHVEDLCFTCAGDVAAGRARGAALAWLVDNLSVARDAGMRAAVRVLLLRLCCIDEDDSQSPLGPATVYRVRSSGGATACADGEPYLHFRCGVRLVGWAVGKSVVIALPKSLHSSEAYFEEPQELMAHHLVDVTCGQRDWFDRRYEPEVTIALYQLGEQCIAAESCHHLYIPARASERSLSGAAVGECWQMEFPPDGSHGPESSEAAAEEHDGVIDEDDGETFSASDDG